MRLLAGLVAVMAGLPSTSSGSVGVAQASGLSARNRAISVRGGGDKQAELEALLGDDVVKKAKAANAPRAEPMPDKNFGGRDEEIAMNKQQLKQTGIQDYSFHREWVRLHCHCHATPFVARSRSLAASRRSRVASVWRCGVVRRRRSPWVAAARTV